MYYDNWKTTEPLAFLTAKRCSICDEPIEDHRNICDYCIEERQDIIRKAFKKVLKAIRSCKNKKHLKTAISLYRIFENKFLRCEYLLANIKLKYKSINN